MKRDTDRDPPPAASQGADRAPVRRIDSQELMGNAREIEISHAGQLYRLRLTSLGKLILTK